MRIWAVAVVGWALACTGAGSSTPAPPEPQPPADPPRIERAGPVVPARVVEVSGSPCAARVVAVGAVEAPATLGVLGGTCPTDVALARLGDRVVVSGGGGLRVLGGAALPPTPAPVDLAAVDADGVLRACGRADAKVTVGGIDLDAEYRGRKLLGLRPRDADGAAVAVGWALGDDRWIERGADLVYTLPTDPPGFAACARMSGWPVDGAATSWGARFDAPPAIVADQVELSALAPGDWRVDATRTVGNLGGAWALFVGGRWTPVATDATGGWVLDDFVGVRDATGVRLISRRDGSVAYTAPAGVVAVPWPRW
jgi:hypothetical protein